GHRSISSTTPFANSATTAPNHNHIGHSHQHHHHPRSSACLDYRYYLNRQGTSSHNKQVLTEDDLRELSPIFIQQILSGACEQLESRDSVTAHPTSASLLPSSSSKALHAKMNATNASFGAASSLHSSENVVLEGRLFAFIWINSYLKHSLSSLH